MPSDQVSNALAPTATGASLAAWDPAASLTTPIAPPFASKIKIIEGIRIAGTTHVNNIEAIAAGLEPGTELRLVHDIDNQFDRWAVKVLTKSETRIGFLPADVNEIPARLLDGGKRVFAQVVAVEHKGSWCKIEIEVYLDD